MSLLLMFPLNLSAEYYGFAAFARSHSCVRTNEAFKASSEFKAMVILKEQAASSHFGIIAHWPISGIILFADYIGVNAVQEQVNKRAFYKFKLPGIEWECQMVALQHNVFWNCKASSSTSERISKHCYSNLGDFISVPTKIYGITISKISASFTRGTY